MAKQVSLPPKLDTAAAAALRTELENASGDSIAFDAAQVEQLGAACLEMLLSAVVLWRKNGQTVSFENVSQTMADDLGRFGLTPDRLAGYAA
jgi:chemotaxis protein CheX